MTGLEKNCPMCDKKFTSLIEHIIHIGKDHRDVPPDRILEIDKEHKNSIRGQG